MIIWFFRYWPFIRFIRVPPRAGISFVIPTRDGLDEIKVKDADNSDPPR